MPTRRSTGCAKRCAAIQPMAMRTTFSSVALQQTGATAEAARERELAERLSSKYKAWEAKATNAEPVPRGLERLVEELMPARARVDNILNLAGQRDQEKLAAFHLDAGRRAFEREADREAIQELRRAVYISPYLAEAHLLAWPALSARRPRVGCRRRAEDRAVERGHRAGAPRAGRGVSPGAGSGAAARRRLSAHWLSTLSPQKRWLSRPSWAEGRDKIFADLH